MSLLSVEFIYYSILFVIFYPANDLFPNGYLYNSSKSFVNDEILLSSKFLYAISFAYAVAETDSEFKRLASVLKIEDS